MSGRLIIRWSLAHLGQTAAFCVVLLAACIAGAQPVPEPPPSPSAGDADMPPKIMSDQELEVWQEHPDSDWVEFIEFKPREEYLKLLRMRYGSEGAGYRGSYFGVEGFLPLKYKCGESLWFTQAFGFMGIPDQNLMDKPVGMNVGLAHRYYESALDRVIGAYIFYDYRNTGLADFNQVSLGLDVLGRVWDARANFYVPTGNVREGVTYPGGIAGVQSAMTGLDFEVGKLVRCYDRLQVRTFGGFYYFEAPSGDPAIGVETRVEGRLTQNLLMNLSVQYDQVFKTNVVFRMVVNFPWMYPWNEKFNTDYTVDRLGDQIFRRVNIMVDRQ